MTALDLRENISALTIAILSKRTLSVEGAFRAMDNKVSIETIIDMKKFGMRNIEIAEVTGIGAKSISTRLANYYKSQEVIL